MAHPISRRKLARMAALAFKNGLRLHLDAIRLYRSGSYPSVYLMSVLSMEEFGKSLALEEYLWKTADAQTIPFDHERLWIGTLYDHRHKQRAFAWSIDIPNYCRRAIQDIFDGRAETQKQAATYVGLRRAGKTIDYGGKIVNPLKLRAETASEQLTMVNDFLVVLALGSIKGTHGLDLIELDGLFTHRFVQDLRRRWPKMSRRAASQYKRISRLDDLTPEEAEG